MIEKFLNEQAERLAIAIGIIGMGLGMIGMATGAGMLILWGIGLIAVSGYVIDGDDDFC